MKKLIALVLLFSLSCCCAFAEQPNFDGMTLDELLAYQEQLQAAMAAVEEDEIVSQAIDVLLDHWKVEHYEKKPGTSKEGYLEIVWTQVVYITDEAAESKYFENMLCVVEFLLLTDTLGTAPYYTRVGFDECVAVYKDGTFAVTSRSPIDDYRMKTYSLDYTGIIESISNRSTDFNGAYRLLVE